MRWLLFFLLIFPTTIFATEWDAYNFPNPTAGQFQECKMRTTANICDPDGVLSEQSRYRLDHDLKQLETRTRQDNARTFCDKKGVTAAMAVAKHVKGGTTEAVETMANDMLRKWTLDPQCKKAVVIVVSTDDMKFWVARDTKVPVYADEFTQIFMQQKSLFQQGNYQQALTNILQSTWDKALSKQGSPRQPDRGNQGPGYQGPGSGSGGPGGFKLPSILQSKWLWIFVIGIVLPTLCCCCCIYCCCCRGRGGGGNQNRQQVPTNPMGGGGGYPQPPPQQGGGGGGAGGMFRNILSSGGGAAAGSMLGRFLSNRGGGGGGGGGMGGGNRGYGYQGGGSNPSGQQGPVYDDNGGQGGGGLYPSQEVKDRGGGGSWA
ncbi:TPM domain-containing protein [Caenorhabditis elegans]|uniref:TPM domain-containing protein n=1 Tax=Caenorhabditis elegans TaxID=6239 RepID=A5Z2T9_CAEEL|nr:TPM domain-containing protein [Caenorhabditis elegans]CAN99686.1 TPM domain-containing protein [Caenorhabditis elegans]|eukprot:NP_001256474.1 Uncharacterized protein CELE_F15B9.10 [Caenorhabditis elegans]